MQIFLLILISLKPINEYKNGYPAKYIGRKLEPQRMTSLNLIDDFSVEIL